jgi:hypothetical protein
MTKKRNHTWVAYGRLGFIPLFIFPKKSYMKVSELFAQREQWTECRGPSPVDKASMLREIRRKNPFVALISLRSKNDNLMIFELNMTDGEVDEKNPVNCFWLDVDHEFVREHIRKGLPHDRQEVESYEKRLGWGYKAEKTGPFSASFVFTYFQADPLVFKYNPKTNKTRCFYHKDNKNYLVKHLYVKATDNLLTVGNAWAGVKSLGKSITSLSWNMADLAEHNMKKVYLAAFDPDDKKNIVQLPISISAAIKAYNEKS